MRLRIFIVLLFSFASVHAQQQRVDLDFKIKLSKPHYEGQTTALIGIDGAHNNFHQLDGSFAPFGKLMRADGYQLTAIDSITADNLKPLNTMVIVNAIHKSNVGNWRRPIANAFTEKDINILEEWVKNGGSLLVIADHMPCAGATSELALAFGFEYKDGFVMGKKQKWPPETYSKAKGNLFETEITKDIDELAGFTGSGLLVPTDAIPIAVFPKNHMLLLPEVAWEFNKSTVREAVDDLVMGAIKKHGKGKVAFFTEAAMFTAQIMQKKLKVGFNAPEAPQNKQFILNLMHWLDSGKTMGRE